MKESKIFSGQNLTEKVHYVYRVTIDGKYYIGKRTGFLNLGHKTIYCNNRMTDKMAAAAKIRAQSGFFDKEFGCIFFPWSKEAYIMASPEYEQFILPVIRQYDKNACINLLI